MGLLAGSGVALALDDPSAVLTFQRVAHLHPAASRALGAEGDGSVRFVLAEGHGGHIHLHHFHVQVGALREVVHDALADSGLVLKSAATAAEEDKPSEQDREAAGIHNSIINVSGGGAGV